MEGLGSSSPMKVEVKKTGGGGEELVAGRVVRFPESRTRMPREDQTPQSGPKSGTMYRTLGGCGQHIYTYMSNRVCTECKSWHGADPETGR